MRQRHTIRERSMPSGVSLQPTSAANGLDLPGAFQCTILRALELPKPHRDVFLLKDIQGHTLQEIAAILGISIETARVRLERARYEIGYPADPDGMGRAQ
jgi:DNA-directed RNA polymerase specialized sigma24 family protein